MQVKLSSKTSVHIIYTQYHESARNKGASAPQLDWVASFVYWRSLEVKLFKVATSTVFVQISAVFKDYLLFWFFLYLTVF